MTPLFQHSAENPFHISVGAVLVNPEGKVRVHHWIREKLPEQFLPLMDGLSEAYLLMRESLENGESLEEAALRGIREEFGAEGKIVRYLGSITARVHGDGRIFEKTTLYVEVELVSEGTRPMNDGESFTELVWVDPEFLIAQMKEQGRQSTREDLDESKILEAYLAR